MSGAREPRRTGAAEGSGASRRKGVVPLVLVGVLVALVAVVVVVVRSGVFLVTDVQISACEHVDQETLEQLVDVEDGTTLYSVDEQGIAESLERSAWISGVEIERKLPGTLIITPIERTPALLIYISTDDVAWLVSDDGVWITPVSLSLSSDDGGTDGSDESTDGSEESSDEASDETEAYEAAEDEASTDESVEDGSEEGDGEESEDEDTEGEEDALAVAESYGVLLVTDVPSDIDPVAGEEVDSEEVQACLAYAEGFSDEFLASVKSLSAASVEALSAVLDGGVEVALGDAEDIATKEKVVTKLLEEEEGVTYINVREADAYTFRATPSE